MRIPEYAVARTALAIERELAHSVTVVMQRLVRGGEAMYRPARHCIIPRHYTIIQPNFGEDNPVRTTTYYRTRVSP